MADHVGHDPQDFFFKSRNAKGVTGTREKVRIGYFLIDRIRWKNGLSCSLNAHRHSATILD